MTNQELLQATHLVLASHNITGGLPLMPAIGNFTTSTYTPPHVEASPMRAMKVTIATLSDAQITVEEETV